MVVSVAVVEVGSLGNQVLVFLLHFLIIMKTEEGQIFCRMQGGNKVNR